MPVKQNARHTLGLVLAAVGCVGMLMGAACVAAAVGAIVEGNGGKASGMIGCSTVALALSLFLVWRGIVMRKRAMAAGSTMHIEQGPATWSSRTETRKPSFLEENDKDEDAD